MTRHDPRESSKDRQQNAQQRLRDKVAVLERWYQVGAVPEGMQCPKGIGQFLMWEDPDLTVEMTNDDPSIAVSGVFPVSAVTADKPDNSHLKRRALELIEALTKPKKPAKVVSELNRVKAERVELLKQVQNITNEFIAARQTIMTQEKTIRKQDNAMINLREEIARLRKKLSKVTPLHTV